MSRVGPPAVLVLVSLVAAAPARAAPEPTGRPEPTALLRCAPIADDPLHVYGAGFAARPRREDALAAARARAVEGVTQALGPAAELGAVEERERVERRAGDEYEACIVLRAPRAEVRAAVGEGGARRLNPEGLRGASPAPLGGGPDASGVPRAPVAPEPMMRPEPRAAAPRPAPRALRDALGEARRVWVPGGAARLGSSGAATPRGADRARVVEVGGFAIDLLEVDVRAYLRCRAAGACPPARDPSLVTAAGLPSPAAPACNDAAGRFDHPMNCVSLAEARRYCAWRGGRLPTPDEWEKAARGADGAPWPWGERPLRRAGRVANVADERFAAAGGRGDAEWGYDDGYAATAPVDALPDGASPLGALHLVGNVWEWVEAPLDRRGRGMLRGGSYAQSLADAALWVPTWVDADAWSPRAGLRCAYDAPPEG
jgi:formylglycine-generating enzyme required for sulfatase activity